MKQPDEQELVLYYYEALDADRHYEVTMLLNREPDLRERFDALRRILEAAQQAVPERASDYGWDVWQRVASKLEDRRSPVPRWLRSLAEWLQLPPRAAWAGAGVLGVTALVAVAFFAGRVSVEMEAVAPVQPQLAEVPPEGDPNRVLAFNLVSHLEQSQRLITTYVNSAPEDIFDVYLEKAWIEILLTSNRLYRSAAEKTGQKRVVGVLDEMERVLLGLSHLPDDITSEELADQQDIIRDQGTLFRLRILSRNLEQQLVPEHQKTQQL
jgi:hypothetical protein